MEYVRSITEAVRKQDELLKAQLIKAEYAILNATTKRKKALHIIEAMSIHARIVSNRPDIRRRPYNPVIHAQNRRYDYT
jgi:hypothetical protein